MGVADERDAGIAELRHLNEHPGELVAQQQSVMSSQQKLIATFEQRVAEGDAAQAHEPSPVYE